MSKLLTFLVFLAALIYVVLPSGSLAPNDQETPKELSFWGIYDLPDVYSPIIEAFEKDHPGFKISYRQFPNAQEYEMVLKRQMERGKGPDIFLFNSENYAEHTSYINPTNRADLEHFPSFVTDKLTTDRLLFGIPLWSDSLMLYYNKRYYKDGIRKNWYEFAEQTRGISIGGVAMGRLDNLRYGWDILKALFLQKNVQLSGIPQDNLHDTLEFFTRFAYPIDKYYNWNEKLNKNYPDAEVDSFAREKIGAIAGYSSLYYFLQAKSDQLHVTNVGGINRDEIGVATFPQFDVEHPKYLGKYFFLTVSIRSRFPNEAWDFIRLLTNETNAAYYSLATGRAPGRILPITDQDSELIRIQKEQLPNSTTLPISKPVQEKIEKTVERGLKDKRLLREILEGTL